MKQTIRHLLTAMAAALLATTSAHAQRAALGDAPTACNPRIACCSTVNLPGAPACAGAGNPINILTGNKHQEEADLSPLPGMLGIEIVRRYNSAAANEAHPNRANGMLGRGWRLSYEIELQTEGEHRRTLTLADSSTLVFVRGALAPQHFFPADLGQGRLVEQRAPDGSVQHEWQTLNGQRWLFNAQGRLAQIKAPTGEFASLAHDSQGRLLKVTDPQGRSLVLHHADAKTVGYRGVVAIETPVGRFEYAYGSGPQLPNLTRVALPGGVQRHYHHEDVRHLHALTGISLQDKDKTERLSTWLYDAQGWAVLSVKGRPAALARDGHQGQGQPLQPHRLAEGTGLEQVIVERGKQTVIVHNALGQTSQATWRTVDGRRLIESFTGPGCTSCPPANTRWTYDEHGRTTETTQLDAQGRALLGERHALDDWGRVTATYRARYVNGQAQTPELVARFEYPAPFEAEVADATQPTLIARPSVIAGQERLTRMAYNALGQPTQIAEQGFSPIDANGQANTTPISRTSTYTYSRINGRSLLTAIDGPLPNGPKNSPEDSDITTLAWDERGSFVTGMITPAGLRATDERNSATGLLLRRTDPSGVSTAYRYDQPHLLRPTRIERAGQAAALYAYDARGRVVNISDGPGRAIELRYDLADRLVAVVDAQGYKAQTTLDAEGRARIAALYEPQQDQPLRATYRWHDEQGRLAKQLRADGRLDTWQYDEAGRLTQHVDGDDVMHLSRRNARGLQAQIALAPDGLLRAALHAPQATPTASPNASEPATRHDDFGREVLSWRPEQGLATRVFNAGDRVTAQHQRDRVGQAAGQTVSRYDAASRLVERRTLDAKGQPVQTERWVYRGALLLRHGNDAQDTEYGHDAASRIVRTTVTLKDVQGRAVYATTLHTDYDALGQAAAKTLADGQVLRIERQQSGVVRHITLQSAAWAQLHERASEWLPSGAAQTVQAWLPRQAIATDVAHHPYNGITGLTLGNGLPMDKRFDAAGRVTALHDGVKQTTYGYGVGPRITKLGEQPIGYNGFGQLQQQSTARVIKTALAGAPSAAPVATAALAPTAGPIALDKLGRVVNDGVNRYTFTPHGQVHTVNRQDGTPIASYRYNAQRQRVSKTLHTTADHADATTYYLWQDGRLVAEIDGDGDEPGQISAQYLYLSEGGKSQPLAKLEAAQAPGNASRKPRTLFIHAEHRGQPVAMSDAQQRVVWRADVDLWGYVDARQAQGNEAQLNLRLPGQYFDAESGLHDNWHRSYDPRPASALKGNYLSPDPLGYPDGPDAYGYVGGDPVNRVDPMGLYQIDIHYYMTYFLAKMAGLSDYEAQTMALAAQYVDDNPNTWPVDPNNMFGNVFPNNAEAVRRLQLYHFTQGAQHDPQRIERWYVPTPEDRAAAIRAGNPPLPPYISEPDHVYAQRRILNPRNPQLARLLAAANFNRSTATNPYGTAPCTRVQLFGEYLHALEDTFGHRDSNNAPIGVNGGLGHMAYGYNTDLTFNDGNWQVREHRTLAMQREVFQQIRANFGGSQATGPGGRAIEFGDLIAVLTQFNRAREQEIENSTDEAQFAEKLRILNLELARYGFNRIPIYNVREACQRRQDNLRDAQTAMANVPGVILQTPQQCPDRRGQRTQ